MSQYYSIKTNPKSLYQPGDLSKPFKISRSKIENFLKCKRCFYIDRRKGIGQPPGFPFNLNSAVDTLLKKEFDVHRAAKTPHPLMKAYGLVDVVPFEHEKIHSAWRENFTGVQAHYTPANFLVFGAVDDVWVNSSGELIVVDYKATSKEGEVTLDAEWQRSYKNQMEIYHWLLRQNGFKVSNTGYFVYCNGKADLEAFDGKLEFDISVLPYEGDSSWVEGVLDRAKECLDSDEIPPFSETCDFCIYNKAMISDIISK
jgi:hypothetical protein